MYGVFTSDDSFNKFYNNWLLSIPKSANVATVAMKLNTAQQISSPTDAGITITKTSFDIDGSLFNADTLEGN